MRSKQEQAEAGQAKEKNANSTPVGCVGLNIKGKENPELIKQLRHNPEDVPCASLVNEEDIANGDIKDNAVNLPYVVK